jgi:hypothetical protein
MRKDVAHDRRFGDKGDDPHLAAALRAEERENLVNPGKQQRPSITGGAAVESAPLTRLYQSTILGERTGHRAGRTLPG